MVKVQALAPVDAQASVDVDARASADVDVQANADVNVQAQPGAFQMRGLASGVMQTGAVQFLPGAFQTLLRALGQVDAVVQTGAVQFQPGTFQMQQGAVQCQCCH